MIFCVISGGEFLLNHIKRPDDGRCYFQVTAEGQPIKIQRTIFTECFYVIAMAELARASNLSRYQVRNLTLEKIVNKKKAHSHFFQAIFLQGDVLYPITGGSLKYQRASSHCIDRFRGGAERGARSPFFLVFSKLF